MFYDDDETDITYRPRRRETREEVYRRLQPLMVEKLERMQKELLLDMIKTSIYNYRLILYSTEKNYESAIKDCNYLIQANQNDARAFASRAIANSYLGNCNRAVQDCNEAIRLVSGWQNITKAKVYCDVAFAKCQLKDYAGAVQDCKEAIRLASTSPDSSEIAKIYRDVAFIKYTLKDYAGAIQDCDEAVRLDPDSNYESSYYDRGTIRQKIAEDDTSLTIEKRLDLLEQAKEDIETCLKKGNHIKDKLEPLLDILSTQREMLAQRDLHIKKVLKGIETNDYTTAIRECDNAISLDPNNTLLISSKNVCAFLESARSFEQTNLTKAIHFAEQAIAVEQNYIPITRSLLIDIRKKHRQAALTDYKNNNWTQSIVLFGQIIADQSTDIEILSKRGIAYIKLENLDAASKDVETILSYSRSLSKVQKTYLIHLLNEKINYYSNLKQYDLVIKEYDLILQFDAANKHAKEGLQKVHEEFFHGKPDQLSEESQLLLYGYIEFPNIFEQLLRPLCVRWNCYFDGRYRRLVIISQDIMFKISLKYFFEAHLGFQVIDNFVPQKELDIRMNYYYNLSLSFKSLRLEDLEDKVTELTEIMREPTRFIHILSGYAELINIGCVSIASWVGRFFTMDSAESSKITWIEQAHNWLIAAMKEYKKQHYTMKQTMERFWQLKLKHRQLVQLLENDDTAECRKLIAKLSTKLETVKQELGAQQKQLQHAAQHITKCLEFYGHSKGGYYLKIDQCGFGKYERALSDYRQAKMQLEVAEKKSKENSANTGLRKRIKQANRYQEQQEKILQRAYTTMQTVWQQKKEKYEPTQLDLFQELCQMDMDKTWWKINVIEPAIRMAFTKIILDLKKPYRYKIGFRYQEEYEQLMGYLYKQIKQSDFCSKITCVKEAKNLIGNLALWLRSQLLPIQAKSRYFELNIINEQLTLDNEELNASLEPFLNDSCLNTNDVNDYWWKERIDEVGSKANQDHELAWEDWYEKYLDQGVIWYILSNRNDKKVQGAELLWFLLRASNLEDRPTTRAEWILISCLEQLMEERLPLLEKEKREVELLDYYPSAPPLTEEERSEQSFQSMYSIMSLPTHYGATAPPFSDEASSIILNLATQFYYPSLSDMGSIIATAPPLSSINTIIPTAPPKTESSEIKSDTLFNSPYLFFSFQGAQSKEGQQLQKCVTRRCQQELQYLMPNRQSV